MSSTVAEPQNSVDVLKRLAGEYPKELIAVQLSDVKRIAFNIGLVQSRVGTAGTRVCDLGGGIGMFSLGCAALGMRATLVDDFRDNVNDQFSDVPKTLHSRYAVDIVNANVIDAPPTFAPASFDAVTTFDSMEHWHNSPKHLLSHVMTWLRPGGIFVVGVPNCVNLRKRLTVPFGRGSWSSLHDWYETDMFRGHVREPDTHDLRYIANDMGLINVEIIGRNWMGYISRFGWVRALTPFVDAPLSLFPSLCADIYMVGTKPL